MKELVKGKKSIRMILITIILMLMFNFTIPNYSQAGLGGTLLRPFTDLFCLLGDAVCGILQMCLVDGEFFSSGSVLDGFLVSSGSFNAATYDMEFNDDEVTAHKFYSDEIDKESSIWKPTGLAADASGESFEIGIDIPVAKYTPDSIFAGEIPALDINFIEPKDWKEAEDESGTKIYTADEGNAMNKRSVAYNLHNTIATWYVALRNLAAVGLMVILVYVGIRIVISSTASDKAKYKQLMMDWLIAMCILFCLHYIMSFTITITQEITNAITGGATEDKASVNNIPVIVYKGDSSSTTELVKFNTNLTGLARFQAKMSDGGTKLIYTIIYMALVIYTCMFTFTYLKRVITMAFLTLIAPLVAFTYPIDKMNDGKAQAFNMWLKEYVFNALLQPFHLILYTVLVTSAIELASTNFVYAIVALAFITPAEKILRKFFGFEKATTAGTLGAFASVAGGAAAFKALGKVANRGGKGGKGNKGGDDKIREKRDPNAPSGVDGYTGHNDGVLEGGRESDEQSELDRDQAALDELRSSVRDDEDMAYLDAEQARISEARNAAQATQLADSRRLPDEEVRRLEQTQEGQEEKPIRFLGKVGNGLEGAGTAIRNKASTTLGNKHWRRQLYKKAGKGAIHLAGRAATTVALGSVGLAAGIAGDNLEDVITYGLGGATLGATVGGNSWNNTLDRAGRGIVNSSPVQGFVGGFTNTTRLERDVARRQSELQADPEFMQQINEDYKDGKLGGKELREATARAAQLATSGVETSKIGKTMKLEDDILGEELINSQMEEEEKRKLAREQATTAAIMAEKIKNPEALVGEKGEELQKRWAAKIQAKNKDLSREEAQANAALMMKHIRRIKGV